MSTIHEQFDFLLSLNHTAQFKGWDTLETRLFIWSSGHATQNIKDLRNLLSEINDKPNSIEDYGRNSFYDDATCETASIYSEETCFSSEDEVSTAGGKITELFNKTRLFLEERLKPHILHTCHRAETNFFREQLDTLLALENQAEEQHHFRWVR